SSAWREHLLPAFLILLLVMAVTVCKSFMFRSYRGVSQYRGDRSLHHNSASWLAWGLSSVFSFVNGKTHRAMGSLGLSSITGTAINTAGCELRCSHFSPLFILSG